MPGSRTSWIGTDNNPQEMDDLFARGKLLLSSEYMVLHGSNALAVPLQQGQLLRRIRRNEGGPFLWRALYENNEWFRAEFTPGTLEIRNTSDQQKANHLKTLLLASMELMPAFQEDLFKMNAETILDFSPEWGFGSSSTLIALLAEWAEVNPLDLHFMVSEGSGYDVACAIAEGPIHYRLRDSAPHYRHVEFNPPFRDQLYFAWLGKKQSTAAQLVDMAGKLEPDFETIHRFSGLTEAMTEATDLAEFRLLMSEHEQLLSGLLGMDPVASNRFRDLPGSVKSLGAWGGDFVMIASDAGDEALFSYLYDRDLTVIYKYGELVYERNELLG